ncbi:MAG: hypothetical protein ACPG8I_08125, partial [Candidatus Poseidoniaceae archaeon]
DGYGDNATGLQPDACPGEAGTSTTPYGCVDDDGDGYANFTDDFPNDPTRWIDSDSDGYDDGIDAFPADPTEWVDSDEDGIGNNADVDSPTRPCRSATRADGTLPTALMPSLTK